MTVGLYAQSDTGVCADCGHPAYDHDRIGFKKSCCAPRCRCGDLEEQQ